MLSCLGLVLIYFAYIYMMILHFPLSSQLVLLHFSHRHIDSAKSAGNMALTQDGASVNIYPVMLRVSVTRDNALTVKIGKKVHIMCVCSALFF
jgi:hypothetical protein